MTYQKLGLKCGIEIHQQLEGRKLFCSCPTKLREDKPHFELCRKIRSVAGEQGNIDQAAKQEQLRDKDFVYEGYYDTTCLVETDSEPPHKINQDALYTCLQFCKMLKSNVSPVVQVMRKTVADGSNTTGFQRTALISRGGELETSEGIVGIENISLEEDACKIVSDSSHKKIYRLDRLGIPLVEVGTAPDIKSPEQCLETSKKLGMFLRSLPGVKRGLGTIRQDVNVSIKEGERVEIKGAQDLKLIPKYVELEVKRQAELIKLRTELKKNKVKLQHFKIYNLTKLLSKSQSKIIVKTFKNNGGILAIKLNHFSGLIGRELQPGYRLGTEFAGRAKVKGGVGGIFHSDEMPNYGITQQEVDKINVELKCKKDDAFILVADTELKCKLALEAVYERAQELFKGIPKEVRSPQDDGTTRFMRPMPGAARMYPETDVPLIIPDTSNIELPELLSERIVRYQTEYKLSNDLAEFVAKSTNMMLFEKYVTMYPKIKAAFIAESLTSTLLEIKRKYKLDVEKLTEDNYDMLFNYLNENKIHKDIILDVLMDMIKGKFDIKIYEGLSTEDLHKEIKKIVDSNKEAPFPALMGMCMKALAGKASGKVISTELKKLV
ncbi:Glu-tRNA(Gln) amidotransferase subunit GatE [archaeon]|jgi:glutamyl-tRNA(Gln) amidotransferase subunit E|nr:Glu-tRNA(Gln) amidotransferase subunit GatE [archaeon]MBT3450339.1 Glu-tRNA(Gln) amidotransferase subunit GatE [archaeon]MBT6868886.1 Glu-tRNA(Gln) amidotransferase subunit GatE [archaeon]MBT7192893.1 Glu-tRNA(Gln) amidotransferase subunit GatE [archaeon]MBT7380859.1 Glu-tRNA(Gln) amidotransferase subunit GatE [archaeon]